MSAAIALPPAKREPRDGSKFTALIVGAGSKLAERLREACREDPIQFKYDWPQTVHLSQALVPGDVEIVIMAHDASPVPRERLQFARLAGGRAAVIDTVHPVAVRERLRRLGYITQAEHVPVPPPTLHAVPHAPLPAPEPTTAPAPPLSVLSFARLEEERTSNMPVMTKALQNPKTKAMLMEAGERIRNARVARGENVPQVATGVGVSKATMWAYEAGRAAITADKCDAIEDYFGWKRGSLPRLGAPRGRPPTTPPALTTPSALARASNGASAVDSLDKVFAAMSLERVQACLAAMDLESVEVTPTGIVYRRRA